MAAVSAALRASIPYTQPAQETGLQCPEWMSRAVVTGASLSCSTPCSGTYSVFPLSDLHYGSGV